MPSITFTSTPFHAFILFTLSNQMKIPAHAGLREVVRTRIKKAWPEIETGIPEKDPKQKESRTFEITSEEQSALGLGFWDMYMDSKFSDGDRELFKALCAPGKLSLSGWLAGKIAALPPITELLQSDDGPVSDPIEPMIKEPEEKADAPKPV